jgi:peptidoglycan/xylan/chitin deacetylase (PgdA/CDA1 family)
MKFGGRERSVNRARTFIGFIYVLLGKPFLRRSLTAFVFHEVSDNPNLHARETNTYSDVQLFKKQMGWIKESFSPLNAGNKTEKGSLQGCLVTFDDGYKGVLSNALPILEDYQVPAVCFVNMATVEGEINSSALAMYMARKDQNCAHWENSNPRYFNESIARLTTSEIDQVREYQGPFINERELELLSLNPLITIGDHLHNHWHMNSLGMDELNVEIAVGQSKLSNFAWDNRFFATPHAVAADPVIQSLAHAGYSIIFSGKIAFTVNDSTRVYPRIDMNVRIRSRYQMFGAIAIAKARNFQI